MCTNFQFRRSQVSVAQLQVDGWPHYSSSLSQHIILVLPTLLDFTIMCKLILSLPGCLPCIYVLPLTVILVFSELQQYRVVFAAWASMH